MTFVTLGALSISGADDIRVVAAGFLAA
jgi:hypothetical protein